MTEVQSFGSLEEAYAYIRTHEIATNTKFVKRNSRDIFVPDVTTLSDHRCFYTPMSDKFSQETCRKLNDGIPFILLGKEDRMCQYGPQKNSKKQCTKEVSADLEMGIPEKKRKVRPSKKVDCKAKIRIKKFLKFPEYYLEPEKRTQYAEKTQNKKLRTEFSERTKRYIQVIVQIDLTHNHDGLQFFKRFKPKTVHSKIDDGCTRLQTDIDKEGVAETPPVLKRLATLKGTDMSDVVLQFKTINELPKVLARPKVHQNLEDMNDSQLMSLYYDITGDVPNVMFTSANKEFTTDNLRLLLHLCIMFANAAGNEQTHRSVRIKGTENEFSPVQCEDSECAFIEPHMHCPFCAVTDSYTDPNLLKAHYTKQHVNKALEFSGLKILRCYDLCEVASQNLVCKTFVGGHWHCYKCSSAFEISGDTMNHYQMHLREFESSFLIHVTQDVNPSSAYSTMTHEIYNVAGSNRSSADSLETYTATRYVSGRSPMKRHYDETGYGNGTVLYVEEDDMGNVLTSYTTEEVRTSGEDRVVVTYNDCPDVAQLKSRIQSLELYCKKLEKDNILQKSLIEFLEKKNADQGNIFNLEKEKLIEEITALKGSESIVEEMPEVGTSGVDASVGDETSNSVDKYGTTPLSKLIKLNNSRSTKQVECLNTPQNTIQSASVPQPVCTNTSSCELSDVRKDIAELKNVLYMTLLGGNGRLGTTSNVQNTSQLVFIPNQGITNPSQNVFPQNIVGAVPSNPISFITSGMNFPVSVPQKTSIPNITTVPVVPQGIPNTTTVPVVPQSIPNTTTVPVVPQSISSQTNKPDYTGTSKGGSTDLVSETQLASVKEREGATKCLTDILQKEKALTVDMTNSVKSSSETNSELFENVAEEMEASDTSEAETGTLYEDKGNNEEMEITVESLNSGPVKSVNKVLEEEAELGTKTDGTEMSETDSEKKTCMSAVRPVVVKKTVNTETADTCSTSKPLTAASKITESSTSQSEVSSIIATVSESGKTDENRLSANTDVTKTGTSSTSQTTVTNSVHGKSGGVMNVQAAAGSSVGQVSLQNSRSLMFIPNQSFMSPYIGPQNITGFVNTPQLNPFQILGATNTFSLNSQCVQNSAPLVFLPNLGGVPQYIVPQNNFVGAGTMPEMSKQAEVNVEQGKVTSDSPSKSTACFSKKSDTEAFSEGPFIATKVTMEDNAAIFNTVTSSTGAPSSKNTKITVSGAEKSDTGPVSNASQKTLNASINTKTPRKVKLTVEQMKTTSTSKASSDTGKDVSHSMKVVHTPFKVVANTTTSGSEDETADKKGYVFVLSAKPSDEKSVDKRREADSGNTKPQVTSPVQLQSKTSESPANEKRKVVILSVKGNVDSKSLSQLLEKYKK